MADPGKRGYDGSLHMPSAKRWAGDIAPGMEPQAPRVYQQPSLLQSDLAAGEQVRCRTVWHR
jgi:hypothetical protein